MVTRRFELAIPSLESYLTKRAGQPVKDLPVISAANVPGIVKSVDWIKFQHKDAYDLEASWAKIEWQNGNFSFTTIDFLDQIKVC